MICKVLLSLSVVATSLIAMPATRSHGTVSDELLSRYTGGSRHYCMKNVSDPAGVDCDACLLAGNGPRVMIKCLVPADDLCLAWDNHQNPTQMWDDSDSGCSGDFQMYWGTCLEEFELTGDGSTGACARTYTTNTFVGTTGGYCGRGY